MEFFKANIQREVRLSFMSTGLGQAHNGDLSLEAKQDTSGARGEWDSMNSNDYHAYMYSLYIYEYMITN